MPRRDQACSRKRLSALLLFFIISMSVWLAGPSSAWAHKVNVFAYVEGNTIFTESYFNDGRKCRDSIIEVFNEKGEKILDGETDLEGKFSFPVPSRTGIVIRLSSSAGHRAEYTIPEAELPGGATDSPPAAGTVTPEVPNQPTLAPGTPDQQAHLTMAEVEEAIDRALARQVAPIRRELEESRARARFSDIVGGIGYIIGLVGLVMYFRSKQRRKQE